MATPTISNQSAQNQAIWNNLKQVIATSSGFQRWQQENKISGNMDETVRQYLRSTLETLAY